MEESDVGLGNGLSRMFLIIESSTSFNCATEAEALSVWITAWHRSVRSKETGREPFVHHLISNWNMPFWGLGTDVIVPSICVSFRRMSSGYFDWTAGLMKKSLVARTQQFFNFMQPGHFCFAAVITTTSSGMPGLCYTWSTQGRKSQAHRGVRVDGHCWWILSE